MTENPNHHKPETGLIMEKFGDVKRTIRNAFKIRSASKAVAPATSRGPLRAVFHSLFRLFGEIVSIVLGVVFLWVYTLSWILAQDNVDISFLGRNAEIMFSEAFDGQDAEIGQLFVDWKGVDNALIFEARDASVRDAQGIEIERVARLSLKVGVRTALRGHVELRELFIDGGSVTALREADGQIRVGIGRPDRVGAIGPVWRGSSQRHVVSQPSAQSPFQAALPPDMTRISVANATGYIVDRQDDLDLKLEEIFFDYAIDDTGPSLTMDMIVVEDTMRAPVAITFDLRDGPEGNTLTLGATGINLQHIAPLKGPLAVLKAVNVPIDVNGHVSAGANGAISQADIRLTGGAGQVDFQDIQNPVTEFSVQAAYDDSTGQLNIDTLALESEKLAFAGSAWITPPKGLTTRETIHKRDWPFSIDLNDITLDAIPIFPDIFDIPSIQIAGVLDGFERQLDLSTIALDFGDFAIDFKGRMAVDDASAIDQIRLEGPVKGDVSPEALLSLWPVNFATGARRWIDRSITAGLLRNFEIFLDVDGEALKGGGLDNEDFRLSFEAVDADVLYIRTMTPYTGVSGQGVLLGNRFDFQTFGGRVGDLEILEGSVEIPRLNPHGGDFTIDLKGRGGVRDMLTLINQKPFEFADRYGVDPDAFSGEGTIDVTITRPLLEFFDQDRIRYAVSGFFQDVSAPFSMGSNTLNKGELLLKADKNGLTVKGPVKIGDWAADLNWKQFFDDGVTPARYQLKGRLGRSDLDSFGIGLREFFGGEIDVSIDATGDGVSISSADITADLSPASLSLGSYWSKAEGVEGQLSSQFKRALDGAMDVSALTISAPGFSVSGAMGLESDFRLKSLTLDTVNIEGFADGQMQINPNVSGDALSVNITGAYLDVSPFVSRMFQAQTGGGVPFPLELSASISRLALNEAYIIRDANVAFIDKGVGIERAQMKGETRQGPFLAEIEAESLEGPRSIAVDIPDASSAIFAFFKLDSIMGGRLRLDGALPPVGTPGAVTGQVDVESFTLLRAPILARILSLASLQGLGDALSGAGLKFQTFEVPFSWQDGNLSIREARASGPALGMTGNGEINFALQSLDVDGVLVPAYSANSVLGSIPVIGDIFVGKKGEGIFALNYLVQGPFNKSQISINPLSALTPGFLRGIFQPVREDMPRFEAPAESDEEPDTKSETDDAP